MLKHPLNRGRPSATISRFLGWQVKTRLSPEKRLFSLVNDTQMTIQRGMTGATGNLYCGLHEFEDMALVLHSLRPGDLFVDIGANVGSYTLLGATTGADVVSIEPIPITYAQLKENVDLNTFSGKIETLNIGLGRKEGSLRFTSGHDTVNHVLAPNEQVADSVEVPVRTLDELLAGRQPSLIKIDVEGFEAEVLAGASQTLSNPLLFGLIVELNGSGRRYGLDETVLHQGLLERGFAVFDYNPSTRTITRAAQQPCRHAGNTLYLRRHEEVAIRTAQAHRYRVSTGADV